MERKEGVSSHPTNTCISQPQLLECHSVCRLTSLFFLLKKKPGSGGPKLSLLDIEGKLDIVRIRTFRKYIFYNSHYLGDRQYQECNHGKGGWQDQLEKIWPGVDTLLNIIFGAPSSLRLPNCRCLTTLTNPISSWISPMHITWYWNTCNLSC